MAGGGRRQGESGGGRRGGRPVLGRITAPHGESGGARHPLRIVITTIARLITATSEVPTDAAMLNPLLLT